MSDTAREQVEAILEATAEAPEHLRRAWNAAYKRRPGATTSYSESIKAVESAYAPLVSRGNKKQSLDSMIRDISAKSSKWQCVLESDGAATEPVLGMMRALWQGELSRHGIASTLPEESVAKARVDCNWSSRTAGDRERLRSSRIARQERSRRSNLWIDLQRQVALPGSWSVLLPGPGQAARCEEPGPQQPQPALRPKDAEGE